MKKVLALILALVLALSLVACGGNNNKIVGKWVSKVEVKTHWIRYLIRLTTVQ